MLCEDDSCFKHPSTQWGLCRPEPTEDELPAHEHPEEEEPILPTGACTRHITRLTHAPLQPACGCPNGGPQPVEEAQPVIASPVTCDPPATSGFHFWTPDELLYNSKLHIDEDHHYARPRIPNAQKEEL